MNIGNGQGDNYTEITPVYNGGVIYAASENGNVAAIDSTTETRFGEPVDGVVTGGVGAGEGMVMLATESAEVVVLDQDDGTLKWQQRGFQ